VKRRDEPIPKVAFSYHQLCVVPTSVVARSKAWVCGRTLAEIAGSNPAGDMDVCLL
jgi:hypothetical protein